MENKKIIMLRHAPMNLHFDNKWYLNQLGNDINPNDVVFIDATSRNKDKEFIQYISPFFIGPVTSGDGKTATIFENFWQFGKVYEGKAYFQKYISRKNIEEQEFICSDKNGNPTDEWFRLREFGFNEKRAYRHPVKGKTLYQYCVKDGKVIRLNYIDSRKKVYIPEYAKLVYGSKSFNYLKHLLEEGKTLALIDFDAYNYYNKGYMEKRYKSDLNKYKSLNYSLDDYLNINTMKDVVNFPGLLAGHGFVLKSLLQGDIEVVDGKVIDNVGLLD